MFGLNRGSKPSAGDDMTMELAWLDTGLGSHVTSMEWSPDGLLLAAAGVEGPIVVLDGATGERVSTPAGHGFGTLHLSWSRDGTVLASAGQDGKIRLWNPRTGRLMKAMDGGSTWVERVAFSPQGPWLASAAGRKLRLWDLDGNLMREFEDHPSTIADIAWRPGTRHLSSIAYGRLALWLPESDAPARAMAWKGSMLAHAWSPNGRFVATGNQDSTVQYWDLKTMDSKQMYGYPTKVRELAWDSTSRFLATGGGGAACVWDFAGKGPAGSTPAQLRLTGAQVRALAFRPKTAKPLLVAGFADGSVGLWELGRSPIRVDLFQLDQGLTQLGWRPDGSTLAIASESGGLVGFRDVGN